MRRTKLKKKMNILVRYFWTHSMWPELILSWSWAGLSWFWAGYELVLSRRYSCLGPAYLLKPNAMFQNTTKPTYAGVFSTGIADYHQTNWFCPCQRENTVWEGKWGKRESVSVEILSLLVWDGAQSYTWAAGLVLAKPHSPTHQHLSSPSTSRKDQLSLWNIYTKQRPIPQVCMKKDVERDWSVRVSP